MKSTYKFVSIAALLLVSILSASAQQRTATKAEIEKLETSAETKLETLSYREKDTSLGFRDDRQLPYYKSTTISEYLRPNRERTVSEEKDEKGISRSETIIIGKKRYVKEDNGPWKLAKNRYPEPISMISMAKVDESNVTVKYEYLYFGEQTVNGVVADFYQVTTTRVLRSPIGEIINPSVTKYWFDKKGRFVKTQTDTTDSVSRSLHQEITEYEYDAPIKIEAPIK